MICTCAVHCALSPYHESACCNQTCDCWCHAKPSAHSRETALVVDEAAELTPEAVAVLHAMPQKPRSPVHYSAGPNEPVGYVRCGKSGAVHPADYDCQGGS